MEAIFSHCAKMEVLKTEEHPSKMEPTLEEDEWLLKWSSESGNVKKEVKYVNSDSIEVEKGRHVSWQKENSLEKDVLGDKQTSVEDMQAVMGIAEAGKHVKLERDIEETKRKKAVEKVCKLSLNKANRQGAGAKSRLRGDKFYQKLCQDATVSEQVSNLCLFECPDCGRSFTGWSTIRTHSRRSHNCGVLRTDLSKMMKITVCHICKICSRRLLCDKYFINIHLKFNHKLIIDDYMKLANLKANEDKIINNTGYIADKKAQSLCRMTTIMSETVSNMCIYKCTICGEAFPGWRTLTTHESRVHQAKVSLIHFDTLMVKAVCHVCKICSERVLCDIYFIHRHLKQKHNMHESEYSEKFGHCTSEALKKDTYNSKDIDNLCVFQCKRCEQIFKSKRLIYDHKCTNLYNKDCKKYWSVTKEVYHKCKLCIKKWFLCDRSIAQTHLRRFHHISIQEYCKRTGTLNRLQRRTPESLLKSLNISKEIDNVCIFACRTCSKKLIGYTNFKNHVKNHKQKNHNQLFTQMLRGFSYQCKLCGKLILCERSLIYRHMKNIHGVVITENMAHAPTENRSQYKKLCESFKKRTPISFTYWGTSHMPAEKVPIHETSSNIGD